MTARLGWRRSAAALLFLLAGCPADPEAVDIADLTPQQINSMAQIGLYEPGSLAPRQYRSLGFIKGISCAASTYETASRYEALQQVQAKAAIRGADGITNLACLRDDQYDLATNCFATWTCQAEALKTGGGSGVAELPGAAQGTGWVIAPGLVATNHHVVEGSSDITLVALDGASMRASLVASDAANDVALLRAAEPDRLATPIPLADQPVKVGAAVFTIGFPLAQALGTEPKLTDGTVSAASGIDGDPRKYQISVPIQPGNSGGPLLNMQGEAVGITSSSLGEAEVIRTSGAIPQNINYAIKLPYLEALLDGVDVPAGDPLPRGPASLEELNERLRGSILIIRAE